MWMMGYCSDGGDSFTSGDRPKLRTLMPRPQPPASPTTVPSSLNNTNNNHHNPPPCLGRGTTTITTLHATAADHFLSFNHHHHLGTGTHHYQQQQQQISKRDLNNNNNNLQQQQQQQQQVVVSSSRWNPTPEQLQTLEELYRRGTRTPSAEQIQQITAQLRRYGKIEGKNVFYWFQNHKARERQKRRRQLESISTATSTSDDQQQQQPNSTLETKESGGGGANNDNNNDRVTVGLLEGERTNNCSTPLLQPAEKTSVSMQRGAEGVKGRIPESRADERWIHFDNKVDRNTSTWQVMEFLSPPNYLISTTTPSPPTQTLIMRTSNNKQLKKPHNLNFFLSPPPSSSSSAAATTTYYYQQEENNFDDGCHLHIHDDVIGRNSNKYCNESSTTLQLFPLQSTQEIHPDDDRQNGVGEKENSVSDHMNTAATATDISVPPHKFFEFLPLKN